MMRDQAATRRVDAGYATWQRELCEALAAGTALAAVALVAGCIEREDGTHVEAAAGQGGADPGSGGNGGGAPPGEAVLASSLVPYPADRVTCAPTPDGPPYRGSECCFEMLCYAPADGQNCPLNRHENGEVSYRVSPDPASESFFDGPGACACSVDGHPSLEGPFAPNAAAAGETNGDPAATCCYVVGSQYCLGRPFVHDGLGHVAPLSARGDWGLFA